MPQAQPATPLPPHLDSTEKLLRKSFTNILKKAPRKLRRIMKVLAAMLLFGLLSTGAPGVQLGGPALHATKRRLGEARKTSGSVGGTVVRTRRPPVVRKTGGRPNGRTNGGNGSGGQCLIRDENDCSENFKCIAEDLFSSPRCRSLNGQDHEPGLDCSTLGDNDGDSCAKGSMCVEDICRPICKNSTPGPECAPKTVCHIYEGGTPLCESLCDPFVPSECVGETYCTTSGDVPIGQFTCAHKMKPQLGLGGHECTETSDCMQGFGCIEKDVMPIGYCDSGGQSGCCSSFATSVSECPSGFSWSIRLFNSMAEPTYKFLRICAI